MVMAPLTSLLGGRYTNFFIQMVMANGGTIATSDTEGIDSPATIEAMDFFSKLLYS